MTSTDCNCLRDCRGMWSIKSLDSNQISLHFTELNSFLLTRLKIKSGISVSHSLFAWCFATPKQITHPIPARTWNYPPGSKPQLANFTDVLRLDWFQGQTPLESNKFPHLLINLLVDIDGKGRKYLCAKKRLWQTSFFNGLVCSNIISGWHVVR